MIDMTLAGIAAAVGLSAPPGAEAVTVTSVEFDSRKITPGALFVALPGERVDGHDFAGAAAQSGAVAMLGSRPAAQLPTLVAGDGDAVLAALSALAATVVGPLIDAGLTVVGVTGSAGKTSTKDLIAAVLRRAGTVVAPPESFNNEIGHPYTVLRAEAGTDFLVLELSARGRGHIAALARVAPPRVGAVLNVGSAHLGEFGSREAIAVAKGELVEALPPASRGGVAVLNADDPLVAAMASRTDAAVVHTAVRGDAEVRARDVRLGPAARAEFTLVTPEGSAPVRLQVVGLHQVPNALAAAAVGRAVGVDVATVADALSHAGPASKWRMAVSELPGGVTLINDAYNANPESVRAALDALQVLGAGRRTWAVLGEMAELGAAAAAAHAEVGRLAAASGIGRLIAVGAAARPIHQAAQAESIPAGRPRTASQWVPDPGAARAAVLADIRPGDVVLVKASRSVGLERLAAALAEAIPAALAGAIPSALAGQMPAAEQAGGTSPARGGAGQEQA
jgi:UDP-N-acetylmuramoyl-tripeptide--D-alanyl-D-alanine ligase